MKWRKRREEKGVLNNVREYEAKKINIRYREVSLNVIQLT